MSTPAKISYGVVIATLIAAAWLHLGPLVLAVFFSYFALRKLHQATQRKWLSLILFLICLVAIAYAAGYFTRAAWRALPEIADSSLPSATACASEIAVRFNDFYRSFETVMGAQIIISSINTALTAIFVLVVGLPHAAVVVGVTFLCGLLPIVGNLISNTIILFLSATLSLKVALAALLFLIAIHKLEYFLYSKIIGGWTPNPLWLPLIGLISAGSLL